MLESLIKKLNKDDIDEMRMNSLFESIDFNENIENISDDEIETLQTALECVDITDEESLDSNIDRLMDAAKDPIKTINESIINTSKSITISKDDYNEMIDLIKKYSSADDEDKKYSNKRFKSFVNSVSRSIRKCNDDNPADAMILGIITKLCRIFDVQKDDTGETRKMQTINNLNAIKKALK